MARRSGRRHPNRDVSDHAVNEDAAKILDCFLSNRNTDSQTQPGGNYTSSGKGHCGRNMDSSDLPEWLDETDYFPYMDESDGQESSRACSGSRNQGRNSTCRVSGRGNGIFTGSSSPRKRTHHNQSQPSSTARDPQYHMVLRQDSYTMDTIEGSTQTREIKHATYHRTLSGEPTTVETGAGDKTHSPSRKGVNKPNKRRFSKIVKAGKRALSNLRPGKSRTYFMNQTESMSSSRETLPKPESKKSRNEDCVNEDEDDGIDDFNGLDENSAGFYSADSADGGFRVQRGGGGYSADGIGHQSDNRHNITTRSSQHSYSIFNTFHNSTYNEGHHNRVTRSGHTDSRAFRLTASDGSIEVDGVDEDNIASNEERVVVGRNHIRKRGVFGSISSALRSRSRRRTKEVKRGYDECDFGQTSMTRTVHADGYSSTLQTTFTQFDTSNFSGRLDVEDTDENIDKDEVIEECADRLAAIGDAIQSKHAANLPVSGNISYDNFEAMIGNQGVGSWRTVAKVFTVTKQLIDANTEKVGEIKEMALRYIEDKCARWILDKGGFEAMLSDEECGSLEID